MTRDEQAGSADGEIDESAGGVDPTVGLQRREMVAGQLGGNIAAKPGGDAVAEAFVQQRGECGGDYGHADDGRFVI